MRGQGVWLALAGLGVVSALRAPVPRSRALGAQNAEVEKAAALKTAEDPSDVLRPLRVAAAATVAAWSTLPSLAAADDDFSSLVRLGENGGLRLQDLGFELVAYFLKTVITWGVPTAFVGFFVTGAISSAFAGSAKRDRSADNENVPKFLRRLSGMEDDTGPGKEYLEVERLNDKLESFQFSLRKATGGKQTALAARRRQLLRKDLADELGPLTDAQLEAIDRAGKRYQNKRQKLRRDIENAQRNLRASAVGKLPSGGTDTAPPTDSPALDLALPDADGQAPGEKPGIGLRIGASMRSKKGSGSTTRDTAGTFENEADSSASTTEDEAEKAANADDPGELRPAERAVAASPEEPEKETPSADPLNRFMSFTSATADREMEKLAAAPTISALGKLFSQQTELEREYISAVGKVLAPPARERLSKVLKRRTGSGPQGDVIKEAAAMFPLPIFSRDAQTGHADAAHVFVLQFFGDVQASQVSNLRQEVTAVLQEADASRGDQVVLVLNTGGGTVTGYGLAAAQLQRLRQAGLRLTISVEQVAASGGYMMACCADHLVASPFAVLGSIGVITDIPNVFERLKREGIQFQTVTAGKFKRTLTPTKEITEEDIQKTKADIEAVLRLFKTFVATQRPSLTIEDVATGETWFGQDALERGLCDELKTADDVLLDMRDAGAEIYSIRYKEPDEAAGLLKLLASSEGSELLRKALQGRGLLGKLDGLLSGSFGRDGSDVNAQLLQELQAIARQESSGVDETASFSPLFMDEIDASQALRAEAPRRSGLDAWFRQGKQD